MENPITMDDLGVPLFLETPGDSIRDLLIPFRWRSRFAIDSGSLTYPQKGHEIAELPGSYCLKL